MSDGLPDVLFCEERVNALGLGEALLIRGTTWDGVHGAESRIPIEDLKLGQVDLVAVAKHRIRDLLGRIREQARGDVEPKRLAITLRQLRDGYYRLNAQGLSERCDYEVIEEGPPGTYVVKEPAPPAVFQRGQ
jgi:hypothetical protein